MRRSVAAARSSRATGTAPGVGPRAAVREDAPGEHDRRLVLRPKLAERLELGFVEECLGDVELRLDVRLGRCRPHGARLALRAEKEADRLREDRLPRARLAAQDVQPWRQLELGLADEHEVLDPEAAKHRLGW